jgi:hypothetical protein
MEFRSIMPGNGTVVLSRAVASILSLNIVNGRLSIIKYTEQGSILWSKELGDFGTRVPRVLSLKEDEKGYIYIVTDFLGIFRPYYDIPDIPVSAVPPNIVARISNENTLVLKLSDTGNIITKDLLADLYNSVLVKIGNDVWMLSSYWSFSTTNTSNTINTINMRNLSTGGNISDIFFNSRVMISNAYHYAERLYIVCLTTGQMITYKGKIYDLGNTGALLLILDTVLWKLWDYFMAVPEMITSDTETPEVPRVCQNNQDITTEPLPLAIFETVTANSMCYFVAGNTSNANRITFYHRKKVIEKIGLTVNQTLMICRFSPIVRQNKIKSLDFKTLHLPSSYQGKLQMLMSPAGLDCNILVKGFVNGDGLYKYIVGKNSEIIHNKNVLFVLQLSEGLEILNHTFIGTPSLGNPRADCDCNDCDDEKDYRGVILPCIPMRLFPPGPITVPPGCTCCEGKYNQINTSNQPGKYPIYICPTTHCGPRASGAGSMGQPGDLYNTKYNPNYVVPPLSNSGNPNASNVNDQMIEIEDNTSIVIFNQLIDKLLINGVIKKNVYKQKWYGFILFFNYDV